MTAERDAVREAEAKEDAVWLTSSSPVAIVAGL